MNSNDLNKFKSTSTASTSEIADTRDGPATSERVHVDVPATGTVQVLDTQGANEINFNFDLASVRISAIDVDLVIQFPDGSKLILPGLAMDLIEGNSPKIRALNKLIDAHDLTASITATNIAEQSPSVHLASTDFLPKKQGGSAANDKAAADGAGSADDTIVSEAPPVVTPVRPASNRASTKDDPANIEKIEKSLTTESVASARSSGASGSAEAIPLKPPSSSAAQASSAAKGTAPFSLQAAELNVKALAITGSSETEQSNGKIIIGGGGAPAAAEDTSFAAQSARESLAGGIGNDIIYADHPLYSASGSASRLLDVSVTMPTSGIVANNVVISGLPIGYSILNAQRVGNTWEMPINGTQPNNFKIQLVYKIPDDAEKPDANGFYQRFTMSMAFNGSNTVGAKGSVTASTAIGIRDVNSDADQTFIDSATGKPMVVLYHVPAGNNISAGDGNDTIYAAAGADIIDGGDGHNLVNYGNSQSGISVNLATGDAKGGFATNDILVNIQAITGSVYADTLIGSQSDNTFSGGAGSDSIDGGTGSDFADYSASATAITVNLQTGEGLGGDAQGDTLRNIEAIQGTIYNDMLIASASGSTLMGGKGNDCIIGTGGSDIMRGGADHDYMLIDQSFLGGGGSIDGGSGNDTLSFAANSGNITLTSANFANVVTNTEVLDFTAVGTNITMSLNASDIASMTGKGLGTSNSLDIFQNAGDQISVATQAGYTFDTSTSNGVTTYTFYNSTDPHDPANQLAQLIVH